MIPSTAQLSVEMSKVAWQDQEKKKVDEIQGHGLRLLQG